MKKISGRPKFNSVFINELHYDCRNTPNPLKVVAMYFDSTNAQAYGRVDLGEGMLSKQSEELRDKFIASLEDDAIRVLFHTTEPAINTLQEESDGPAGIVDEADETPQI